MEDEGRQKKVEAGRAKFAAYLKKKNASDQQSDQKKKKKIENETENSEEVFVGGESLDRSPMASLLEDIEGTKLEISGGSNGTTAAVVDSKQNFKDESEVSSERLQTRLKQLEDILSGKETALEAALEEISALKEITSFDASTSMLETDYKIRFEECHRRLLEFQEAVQHREGIISQLSSSLQQAIQSRDALQLQGDQLAQEVALLQRQLKATTALIQGHHWDTGIKPHDYLTLQNQVLALEGVVSRNESVISDLNSVIKENANELQCKSDDLEKKSHELSQHKTKSANEIQKLMREVEEVHQKCALITSNKNSLILEHGRQMAALQSELEESFGLQLVQIKEKLRNQFNEEKESLERRYVEEMALCQTAGAHSSRVVEEPAACSNFELHSLHLQLQESLEAREKLVKEMAELKESCKQRNDALEEKMQSVLKEREIYEQQVLESRNSSEKELALYKQQIENLKFQLQESKHSEQTHDCNKAFEAELSSCKQSHETELSLYKEQVNKLNLQLHEASKAEAKYLIQLTETKTAYEAYQQSHEMELASYKQRADALNLRLQEASETEENFPKVLAAHKQSLEAEVLRYKEETEALNADLQRILSSEDMLRKEKAEILESHSSAVLSYEEQLTTLKATLEAAEETIRNHERDLSSVRKRFEDSINVNESYVNEVQNCKEQIVTLRTQLEEALNANKTFEQDFALCKKSHEPKINLIGPECTEGGAAIVRRQPNESELTLCKQQIEYLNLRLQDANDAEKCHISEITACQIQLKEYKDQIESLDRKFGEELVHVQEDFCKEVNSKNQEIELLRARLEEAAVAEGKFKSQILYLEKDNEGLSVQLHQRAETERRHLVELASCEEQQAAHSSQVQASQRELQVYKQEMENLVKGLQCDLSELQGCRDAELKRIEEEYVLHIASLSKEVDRLTALLVESVKANGRLEKEKQLHHESYAVEVDKYKHQLDELNFQLQECRKNFTGMGDCQEQLKTIENQVELQNAMVQEDMSQIKVLHTKEVNDLKDELQYLKNVKATLQAEVLCLHEAAKHKDGASRAQLEEVMVQFLKNQSLLEAKEEVEEAYERRINDLQVSLDKANECIDQMRRELESVQEVTVENLKLQGLLALREEADRMCTEHVGKHEEALHAMKEDSEQMKHDISELTLETSEAEQLTFEKDELSEKCKQLEAKKENLVSEEEMSEEKHKSLVSQVHKLETSSDVGHCVVSSGSSHLPPVTEECVGVVLTVLDNSSGPNVLPASSSGNTEGVSYSEDKGDSCESWNLERRKRYTVNESESGLSLYPAKWMERLITIESEKMELADQLETLESKLQEKDLQAHLCKEENKATILHCKEVEEKLLQLERVRKESDALLQEKHDLQSKVAGLEHENASFRKLHEALKLELAEEKAANEDRLHRGVKERLEYIIEEKNSIATENLILDFGHKAKEIVFLKERLRSQEQACQLLNDKIVMLEKYKAADAKRINLCQEELSRVRSELEESWKRNQAMKEELGISRKEVAMLYIQKQRLESSRNRQADIVPVHASSQQEMHSMLEELTAEVQALRSSLEDEEVRNEKLALELELVRKSGGAAICLGVTDVNSNDSSNSGMLELELQHKLELILRSNAELVAEKESLLDKLRIQQQHIGKLQRAEGYEQMEHWMSNLDKHQSDLMAELRAYREQHTSLAELVGPTGILQETLFRQKQELLQKFKEKSAIEKMLENERAELKSAQLRIQMMEDQMLEKEKIFQALTCQKHVLEQDLREIEDQLRDQEDMLQTQKLTLESEIRDRDFRIQHWQLELKAKKVEMNSKMTLEDLAKHSTYSATESYQNGEWERLEMFHSKLEEVHQQTVARFKRYMEEQFAVHETELQKNYTSEVLSLQLQHNEQLMGIQHQLDAKAKELEAFLNSELHSQLGVNQNLATRLKAEEMAALKERQRSELEEVKNSLDEQQIGIYSVLKQKFEDYAKQQIAMALKIVQDEHDSVHQQAVSNLVMKHSEELKVLQAKLESERQGELLTLHKDLSGKHVDELNEATKGLRLEISLLKQSHDGSSSKSSVQQLKQEMCMEFSSTLKGWVKTWYSDCQGMLETLNKQIYDLWQQEEPAIEETDAGIATRTHTCHTDIKRLLECKELLLTQAEVLHTEVAKRHMQALHSLQLQLDDEHAKLVRKVEQVKRTVQEGTTIASLQDQMNRLAADKEELENKHKLAVDLLAHEHDVEVAKLHNVIANVKFENISGLRELRQEMETKHAKEMEELRQYFEQKCADVEKHYSEEVFNEHSRKLSGSSSGLENEELVCDMYYAGAESSQRLTALTHICDPYTVDPSFKDLEEHYQSDFEKRLLEYRDQLETVKRELARKYQNEITALREEYESKVEDLVRDLSNTHKTEIQNIESKHAKEIQNLKEKLQLECGKEEDTVHVECAREVEKVRKEMTDEHSKELERLKDVYEDELKKQIEHLACSMKQGEEKHMAATKSELLSKHARDIQKLEDSCSCHGVDQNGSASTDADLQKEVDLEHKILTEVRQQCEEEYQKKLAEFRNEMEAKHTKELDTKIEAERKIIAEQFDELTNVFRKSAEEEQDKFMTNQKEMMLGFVKQHQQDLQALKLQHEASLQAVEEECQCEVRVQQLKKEIGVLQEEIVRLMREKDEHTAVEAISTVTVGVSTEQNGGAEELNTATLREMTAQQTILQLRDELKNKALLSNESEDTPRPRELIELQEKFNVQYKQELSVLKEEHVKEVAQLKKDQEIELQSLAEKYSQDIAAMEGRMAAETTQHEFEKTRLAMQIKLGERSSQETENSVSVQGTDLEQLIRERDHLRKVADTLRYLLRELIAYFSVCEDELNNTLFGELLKCEEPEASKNSRELSKNNKEMNDQTFFSLPENACNKSDGKTEEGTDSSIKTERTSLMESDVTSPQGNEILMPQDQAVCYAISVTSHNLDQSLVPCAERSTILAHGTHRVHFAPDVSSIISLIDEDTFLDNRERNRDLSLDFHTELDNCLERLKAEALAILGLSGTLPQVTYGAVMLLKEKVNILTNQLDVEVMEKDELLKQLENVEVKERECVLLQEQVAKLEMIQGGLESDLRAARTQITNLECELGKREDVTEGFGESMEPCLLRRLHKMAQLQDKAHLVLSERAIGDHKSPHLRLIEELCQEGDRLSEEARKERDDLQQQVEAADKQLRATRLFLEEQAAEREQERDDFLQEISKLQEQIRERDHDRNERERLTKEVELLELQVKEAVSEQKGFDLKKEELETELKAAIDKIWMLKDIIGDLESQIETRTQHEAALEQQLHQLHVLLEQQGRTHQELTDELDSLRLESGKSELTNHISHLEEQLRKHRLHVEQFHSDSTAFQQMKAQLRDLEATVDRKTKELESLHATMSSASCGSPSEDVSIREQLDAFRSDTPEEARNAQSPVCLPLDELHRLQDKLLRHSRAEEVALKRIRDLEMQLKGVKRNEEEVTAERDVLQERMEEQLLKISALQSRLDEQRQKADSQLKEVNSELQARVRDQEKEVNRLLETVENKEQEVIELKKMFEESRRIMAAQEREWHTKTADELEMIGKLTETCRKLKAEKGVLEETRDEVEQFTPCLEILSAVLSQKNACIASLQREVEGLKNLLDPDRQKEYEELFQRHQMYTSNSRDELRYQKGDITEGMLSPEMLYTSPRGVLSGSQLDVSDKHLKAMLANKDSELISLKNQLQEKINGDLSKLQAELDKKNQSLLACESQLARMPLIEAKNEALKKAIKALETDQVDCKKKLDAVRYSEGQVREGLDQALKKLDEKQNEINILQSQISSKDVLLQRMDVDKLASVAQLGELQKCRSETTELEKELEVLKHKILVLAAENHNLKDDLNRLPGTPDELAGQVQKELDILNQIDINIMKKLATEKSGLSEDVSCISAVSSTVLSQVLSKAVREGISALKVGEFSFLYQEICKAASAMIMRDSATQMEAETMHPSRADEDRLLMIARINAPESEVACKQQEAQNRIHDLEVSVCGEKEHVVEMQEQLWRTELQSQSSVGLEEHHHHLQKLSSDQENQLRQLVIDLEGERARTRQLQEDLRKKDRDMKTLQAILNDERLRTRDAKLKDAALIEDLRIKLNTALDNESKQEFQMAQMRYTQKLRPLKDPVHLVCQCKQTACSSFQTLSSYKSKLELVLERCEKLEFELQREKQNSKELEIAVEKEKQLGQQKVEIEKEIIQELKREFLTLEGQRDSLSAQLVHVREQLSLARTETEAMERRVHVLQKADDQRQRKRLLDQGEMERNRRELHKSQSLQFGLEQRIVGLEQEVSRLRQATELDEQNAQLGPEEELRQGRPQSLRELSSSPRVLSPVVEKLKNVNVMLEQHMTENAEVALTLSRLTEERQHLQARVKQLEEQLNTTLRLKAVDEADSVHVAFATERALWAQEKTALKLALAEAEANVHGNRTADGLETSDRMKYLLGKYLRSESYRKALIWQKRYLLVVLGGYQESEVITVSRLAHLSGVQETMLHQRHSALRTKPKARFRIAAVVVVALSRMRYLVRRWQHGHRIGRISGLSRGISESTLSSTLSLYHGPRGLGSSTSVNSVGTSLASLQGSPPSRDRPMLQRSTVTPLRHGNVAEYVDRFDTLQRRLGLVVTRSPS